MLRIPIWATIAIAGVVLASWIAALAGAHRKLAPLSPLDTPRGDYSITLDFPPERFHQLRLQDAGRLVEVRGNTVYMKDMAPAAVREIAGNHWVASIARWDGR